MVRQIALAGALLVFGTAVVQAQPVVTTKAVAHEVRHELRTDRRDWRRERRRETKREHREWAHSRGKHLGQKKWHHKHRHGANHKMAWGKPDWSKQRSGQQRAQGQQKNIDLGKIIGK